MHYAIVKVLKYGEMYAYIQNEFCSIKGLNEKTKDKMQGVSIIQLFPQKSINFETKALQHYHNTNR